MEFAIGKQILAEADVVLVTHGGIAKAITKKLFDLLIMDEASQATEPLSWIPITQAKKVVFAGDALQLRRRFIPKKRKSRGSASRCSNGCRKFCLQEVQTLLRIQYRMHETIMGFSSQQFYHGALQADESVRAHTIEELPGIQPNTLTAKPLMFVDTVGAGYEEAWNDFWRAGKMKEKPDSLFIFITSFARPDCLPNPSRSSRPMWRKRGFYASSPGMRTASKLDLLTVTKAAKRKRLSCLSYGPTTREKSVFSGIPVA